MKLRQRFFIIFFLIAIIPIILITAVAYHRYYTTTYDQMDEFSSNLHTKAIEHTNDMIKDVVQATNMFTFYSSSNSLVQSLRPYAEPNTEHTALTIYQTKQNMRYICQNIVNTYDFIYGLYVFTPSGVVLDYENTLYSSLQYKYDPAGAPWYQDTIQLNGELYVSDVSIHDSIFTRNHESIFFAKHLYDVYSHKFLGVLLVNCNPSVFDLSSVNTMPDITVFTIENSATGGIIYSNAPSPVHEPDTNTYQKKVLTHKLDLEDLNLTMTINYSQLYKEFNVTGLLLISIALTCLVIAFILSYVLSRYVTRPISELSEIMSTQEAAAPTISNQYLSRRDEIGILYNEYKAMMDKLNTSIKMDYQNKLISLDAQMKSLEARINSHFLFNTLACFNSIAEIDGSERLSTMSIALGNMFRYTIKTKSELVSIQDELDHVNDYATIQSIRYSGRFALLVTVPDEMRSLTVLKLILQPLVENAFIHGLQNCQTGSQIVISGSLENDFLIISVTDDGQGIEAGHLAKLQGLLQEGSAFTELGHRNNQSIGLKNIHTRIELYYGKGYGLTIKSTVDRGTCIQIKLPRLDKKG